ncbi:MAG TPA: DUF192 domain-containing protein [Caulobacteraceae bacterium]|nr:DUF192 domain-containing protein [Caulobacteraceae bacterium]
MKSDGWRSWLLTLALVLALAPAARAQTLRRLPTEPLTVATAKGVFRFTVEVADTEATRERGLMFRKSLAPDRGMLFDFKAPQQVAFWMKNTLIPLDMLFISADGRVVSIAHGATPLSETPIPSAGPVLGVLEIRGGRAEAIGAEPGDLVRNRIFHRPSN